MNKEIKFPTPQEGASNNLVGVANSKNDFIIHLFKWPSKKEYQERLFQIISLPVNSRGEVKFNKKYINKSFLEKIEKINRLKNIEGIFWLLSCTPPDIFQFASPIRLIRIISIEDDAPNNDLKIIFLAGKFFTDYVIYNDLDAIYREFNIITYSHDKTIIGKKEGFLFSGPIMDILANSDYLFFDNFYKIYKDIAVIDEKPMQNERFPLIYLNRISRISPLEEGIFYRIKKYLYFNFWKDNYPLLKPNKFGLFDLSLNHAYYINFSAYQGEKYRFKEFQIVLNEKYIEKIAGGTNNRDVSYWENIPQKNKININIQFENNEYSLPIYIKIHNYPQFIVLGIGILVGLITMITLWTIYPTQYEILGAGIAFMGAIFTVILDRAFNPR